MFEINVNTTAEEFIHLLMLRIADADAETQVVVLDQLLALQDDLDFLENCYQNSPSLPIQ